MRPSIFIALITCLVAPVALAHSYDGHTYYEHDLVNDQFSVIQARNILDAFYAVVDRRALATGNDDNLITRGQASSTEAPTPQEANDLPPKNNVPKLSITPVSGDERSVKDANFKTLPISKDNKGKAPAVDSAFLAPPGSLKANDQNEKKENRRKSKGKEKAKESVESRPGHNTLRSPTSRIHTAGNRQRWPPPPLKSFQDFRWDGI